MGRNRMWKAFFSNGVGLILAAGALVFVEVFFRRNHVSAPALPFGIAAAVFVFSLVKMMFAYVDLKFGGRS